MDKGATVTTTALNSLDQLEDKLLTPSSAGTIIKLNFCLDTFTTEVKVPLYIDFDVIGASILSEAKVLWSYAQIMS